jgi:antirestriction protein ArdC
MTTQAKADVYSRVTQKIIADLEQGVRPWRKPWDAGHTEGRITRPLRACGIPYRGMNVLLLWCEAVDKGYSAPFWMTYKQAAEHGAQVRKGEETERAIGFMKGYTVFNVEQVDGLPAQFYAKTEDTREPVARIEQAEAFFIATGADVRHGGNRAYYSPARDFVQMPPRESFADPESYCATRAHETTHWTAHPARLARELGKRFGSEAYAAEELIAEMGAAFLCADLGITPEVRPDHAEYLAHWLEILKADNRAIFTAAAQAQRAADYLHAKVGKHH